MAFPPPTPVDPLTPPPPAPSIVILLIINISGAVVGVLKHDGLVHEGGPLQEPQPDLAEGGRNDVGVGLRVVVVQLDVGLGALDQLIGQGLTSVGHAAYHQFLALVPVILLLHFPLLVLNIQIIVDDPGRPILFKDPRLWINLHDLILMKLIVTYGPLRLTTLSLPFLIIFIIYLHQCFIDPASEIE